VIEGEFEDPGLGGGANLQKSALTAKDWTFDTDREGCHNFIGGLGHLLHARAIDMDDLAHHIGNWTDLPVVHRTAVSGLFAVSTEGWTAMRLPPPPPNALPTIFTVLGKLGPELKQQEATLPVYTVERIERRRLTDDSRCYLRRKPVFLLPVPLRNVAVSNWRSERYPDRRLNDLRTAYGLPLRHHAPLPPVPGIPAPSLERTRSRPA
jgi:hypothetical protein